MATSTVTNGWMQDFGNAVLDLLRAAEEPVSAAKLRSLLPAEGRPDEAALTTLLERYAAGGTLYRYSPYRGDGTRYWYRPMDVYAEQIILAELASAPLSAASLDKKVAARLVDCPPPCRREILDGLLEEGKVYQLPPQPGERAALYRSGTPDPLAYFGPLVNEFVAKAALLSAKLQRLQVPESACTEALWQLLSAALDGENEAGEQAVRALAAPPAAESPDNLQPLILEQLAAAAKSARHGGLVSLRELRQSLAHVAPSKAEFDAVVLALAQDGKVWLYRHDYAASLSEQERSALVCDAKGNYYNGVSLRI